LAIAVSVVEEIPTFAMQVMVASINCLRLTSGGAVLGYFWFAGEVNYLSTE
jgi:hypothetical protein